MIWVVLVLAVLVVKYWLFMSPFSQVFGAFPYRAKTTKKLVALTFDDGPNEPYTTELLDYLAKEKVQATFFVVGSCAEKYPFAAKRIVSDGHVVGNHSYSHQFRKYLTQPTFNQEIEQSQATIQKITGRLPALFRPPWLLRQPWILTTARKHGLQVVSGEFCHPLEVLQVDGNKIANATIKKVKPGSIIIFHDGFDAKGGNRAQTIAAVKEIIPRLKKAGYSFVTVDQLLGIPRYQKVIK